MWSQCTYLHLFSRPLNIRNAVSFFWGYIFLKLLGAHLKCEHSSCVSCRIVFCACVCFCFVCTLLCCSQEIHFLFESFTYFTHMISFRVCWSLFFLLVLFTSLSILLTKDWWVFSITVKKRDPSKTTCDLYISLMYLLISLISWSCSTFPDLLSHMQNNIAGRTHHISLYFMTLKYTAVQYFRFGTALIWSKYSENNNIITI